MCSKYVGRKNITRRWTVMFSSKVLAIKIPKPCFWSQNHDPRGSQSSWNNWTWGASSTCYMEHHVNKRCCSNYAVRIEITGIRYLSGVRPDDPVNRDSPPDGIPCLCHPKRNDRHTVKERPDTNTAATILCLTYAPNPILVHFWKQLWLRRKPEYGKPQDIGKNYEKPNVGLKKHVSFEEK